MSHAQATPLSVQHRLQPSAPPRLNVVANIQAADKRLAELAQARSRSRDGESNVEQPRAEGASMPFASPSPTHSLPLPRPRMSATTNVLTSGTKREPGELPRRSASPPESVATAAPSSSPRASSSSQFGSLTPLSPDTSSRRLNRVTEFVDLSPLGARPTETAHSAVPVAANAVAAPDDDGDEGELQRTRRQLEELQRLFSYEKRAHLQARTQQLREEARQRRSEEDIVEQTAQLLTEYEALIRFRDKASAEHLDAAMQRLAEGWQRSAHELEKTRDECAASLLHRIEASCTQQQAALHASLQRQLISTAQATVEVEAAQFRHVAAAVQEQVEIFKTEYRAILAQDVEERQRLMDEQAVRREQQWLALLKDEHARVIAAGETAARELSRRQLETLHLAMRDITELRESLVKQHAERQAQVGREYLEAYEALAAEYAVAARDAAAYVQQIQQDYAAVIHNLHGEVRRAVAEKDAAERRERQGEADRDGAVAHALRDAEELTENRWRAKLEEERDAHRAALATAASHQEKALQELRVTHEQHEATRAAHYATELSAIHDHLAHQYQVWSVSADAAHNELSAALSRLTEEKDAQGEEVVRLKDQLRQQEAAHAVALLEVRREHEAKFATQLKDLDAHYDSALQQYKERAAAALVEDGAGVTTNQTTAVVASTSRVLQRVTELEKEMQEMQRQHSAEVHQAVDEAVALWSARLKAAAEHQAEERDALEAQHRALRQSLLAEVREREEAVEARCAAQRVAHQRELQDALLAEKQQAQRIADNREREHAAQMTQLSDDAAARVQLREDAVAARETKLAAAVSAWQLSRANESAELRRRLLADVATECAEQQRQLQEREAHLRDAEDALARQQRDTSSQLRVVVQREERERYDALLRDAQQQWMTLLEGELQGRYLAWQELRQCELDSVSTLHRQELRLLSSSYERQQQRLCAAQEQRGNEFEEEMRARETAWAAARAASLEEFDCAASERLQAVVEREKAAWEEGQRERWAATAKASLEAVAQRAAAALASADADRCRLEEELRGVYASVIEEHETKTAAYLNELHATNEQRVAALQIDYAARLERQVKQQQQETALRWEQHNEELQKVAQSYEARLASLRATHDDQLAQQRRSAQEALHRAHQQASDAQRVHDAQLDAALKSAAETQRRQVQELQERCDAQAAQLVRHEMDMQAQVQQAREQEQATLRAEYEESMSALREALEARNHSYATLQASLYDNIHAEASRVQARMEKMYVAFTEAQQRQYVEQLEAQEATLVDVQQRQQEALARLREQHAEALTAQAKKLRAEHAAAVAAVSAAFDTRQAEWEHLLDTAKADGEAANAAVASLTAQLAQAKVTQAEQQAAAYQSLDKTYRHILDEALAHLQDRRDAVAQSSLEDAEQRFVSSMLGYRSASTPSQPLPLPRPFSSARDPSPAAGASPSRQVRFVRHVSRKLGRGLSTPAASRTPRHDGSPLPISPAGPMELIEENHPDARPASSSSSSSSSPSPSSASLSLQPVSPVSCTEDHKCRLEQLWEVLEVPIDDRRDFLDYVDSLRSTPEAQQRAMWEERRRLEAQLPLLEALTRRDYVARQLRSLRKQSPPLSTIAVNGSPHRTRRERLKKGEGKESDIDAKDDDGHGDGHSGRRLHSPTPQRASSPATTAQTHERLVGELEKLTAELRRDVSTHETRYGQLFIYNGKRVMETL